MGDLTHRLQQLQRALPAMLRQAGHAAAAAMAGRPGCRLAPLLAAGITAGWADLCPAEDE